MIPGVKTAARTRHLSTYFSLLVVGIGLLVLFAWTYNLDLLKRPISGLVAMNPITALCFVLCGLAFIVLKGNFNKTIRRIAQLLLGLVIAFSLLRIIDHITGFKIDELLFSTQMKSDLSSNQSSSMADNTAFNFILLSLSIFSLEKRILSNEYPSLYLALLIALISLISLLGYLYQVPAYYRILAQLPMAIHTAAAFLIMSAALLLSQSDKGFMSRFNGGLLASSMARRMVPVAIVIPIILGFITVYISQQNMLSLELSLALLVLSLILVMLILLWQTINHIIKKELLRIKIQNELKIFKHFFDHSRDLPCIANVQGYYEIVNPEFHKLFGYSEEEIQNTLISEFIHPEDLEETNHAIQMLATGVETVQYTNRFQKKDGSYVWIEWNTVVDPNSARLFSVGRDISLRVAAEERLRTLNDHLEDIVEQRTTELETINERLNKTQKMASLGSWELNLETNILKWSDETCRIYGLLPSNNLLSMDEWFDYVHPKHKEYVKTVVKEANEAKAQASFYYQIIRKDGAVRTLYTLSSFEFNESQIPIGVYGIVQDVTNQPSFNEN